MRGHAGGAAQPTGKGSLAKFVRQQKRKRWCRHLQRVCGTKQIWEVLAYTGRFNVDLLRQTLQFAGAEEELEMPASASEEKQRRRALRHAKAEAKACFIEGRRLASQRDMERQGGASQSASSGQETVTFTRKQLEVLEKWDNGMLRQELNKAIVEVGHGRLKNATGEFMDIGGSTGGGSRRIIDGWVPPDWRQFLEEPDMPPDWTDD